MREALETLNIYLWTVLHHRWLVLIVAVTICALGWTGVALIPDKYMAETRVFIDTDSVLKPLLKGLAIDSPVMEETAEIMRRTITSRPNLLEVARSVDLDIQAKDSAELEKILLNLQNNIQISTSGSNNQRRRDENTNIYSISYINKDAKLAKNVVESILNIFVENILGKKRKDSDQAETFLNKQVQEYQSKLEIAEEKLKVFKQTNAGMMPAENTTYYSNLNSQKAKLEEAQLLLKEKMNKSRELKRQIDALTQNESNSSAGNALQIQSPLDKRIETLQATLDDLLLKYTDKHPDVIATRSILSQLEEQKKDQDSKPGGVTTTSNSSLFNSSLYQELNLSYGQTQAEIAEVKARVETYQAKVAEMESMINNIPKVEAELAKLTRDYGNIKNTYDELVQRRTAAALSRDAGSTSTESQFNIIDPPTMPLAPISPNRLLLISLVFAAGLGGGILAGVFFEQLRPTFYTQQQVEEELELPVIGCMSMNWSDVDFRDRRKDVLLLSIISVSMLLAYLIVLSFNLNLDALPFKIPFVN